MGPERAAGVQTPVCRCRQGQARHEELPGPRPGVTAGQAAACAGEQSRFWDYHDSLYAHQRGENSGAFSSQNLKGFAQAPGLDTAAFGACLDSGRYRGAIDADFEQGRREGVTATPTFIVNGQQRIVGAQPIEAFARVIDPLLGGAGR